MVTFLEMKNPVYNVKYYFHWLIPSTMKNAFIFYRPLISGFNFESLSFIVLSSTTLSWNLHFPGIHFLSYGSTFFFLLRKLGRVLELLQRKYLLQCKSFGYSFSYFLSQFYCKVFPRKPNRTDTLFCHYYVYVLYQKLYPHGPAKAGCACECNSIPTGPSWGLSHDLYLWWSIEYKRVATTHHLLFTAFSHG